MEQNSGMDGAVLVSGWEGSSQKIYGSGYSYLFHFLLHYQGAFANISTACYGVSGGGAKKGSVGLVGLLGKI